LFFNIVNIRARRSPSPRGKVVKPRATSSKICCTRCSAAKRSPWVLGSAA